METYLSILRNLYKCLGQVGCLSQMLKNWTQGSLKKCLHLIKRNDIGLGGRLDGRVEFVSNYKPQHNIFITAYKYK